MATKVSVLCCCGTRIKRGWMEQHRKSRWHKVANEARILRKMGLSYTEISAELTRRGTQLTRARIHRALSKEQ